MSILTKQELTEALVNSLHGNSNLQGFTIGDTLETCFQKVPSKKKQADAESWLCWARSRKDIKVVESVVPAGILGQGIHGTLIDVKVSSRGPDDAVYDANKDMRDKVARGNCFLHIERGSGDEMETATTCIIYALKKFTGGLGDDDDRDKGDNHTWKRYFTKSLESTSRVVCTRKANGEAAHLSVRRIAGQILLCAGSKNVHMLFRDKDDLENYTEPRYRVASEVAMAILTLLDKMEAQQKQLLLSFLLYSEFTGVFEVLQPTYQHVEDLSHLDGPEVRFITWTSTNLDPAMTSSLCSLPPHFSIELACVVGLPAVSYDVIASGSVEDRMKSVREGYQYEGEVLYFMDDKNNVIGLLKKKTIWYIVCRAIREKVRTACGQQQKNSETYQVTASIRKIEKRMGEIKSWLGLDKEATQTWTELGIGYLKWALHRLNSGEIQFKQIAETFPVLWKRYLEETDQCDKIAANFTEEEAAAVNE